MLFKNKYKVLLLIHACQGRYVGHGHPLFQAQSYKKLNKLPNNDEGKDDYNADAPLIAWIHPAVYRSAGDWNMCVVATTEDLTTENDYATGDFYRFISSTLVGIIDNTGLRYKGQDTSSTTDDTTYLMSNDEKTLESNDGLTIDAAKIGSMEEDW